MRAWSSARFTIPLPSGHRFPIAKYAAIRDAVLARGLLRSGRIEEPDRAERWSLELVHSPAYVHAVCEGLLSEAELRRLGFPWSPELRERSLRTAHGTVEAARDALEIGLGINLAGGTHHAFPDHGEGFCVLNDVAVAVRVLQRDGRAGGSPSSTSTCIRATGRAHLRGRPAVFTFSMHGAKNYPLFKRARRSTWSCPTAPATSSTSGRSRATSPVFEHAPDLVFYLGGADPYLHDRLGRLGVQLGGLRARDRAVFGACSRRGVPVVLTLAGGYAWELSDIVEIHAATVAEGLAAYA